MLFGCLVFYTARANYEPEPRERASSSVRPSAQRFPSAAVGRNQIGGSLRPPGLQNFNTEVTAMLRALRVEGLIVTEYTEPVPGIDMLIRT